LYTAPASGQGVHPVQFFEFGLQVTNPNGALTATFTPAAPLAAVGSFALYGPKTDVSGSQTFAWASTGNPDYTKTYDFPATEIVLGTVAFSGQFSGAIVSAVDYDNASAPWGGATGAAVWTMQLDGNITYPTTNSIDVTNYNNLFYQSQPANGIPGSSTPAYFSGAGYSMNQGMALAATPLPLKLQSFNASPQSGKTNTALLTWTATDQVNTQSFTVERSTDGKSFTAIATVAAAGNYASAKSYSFTDANAKDGMNYYRLKMTDIDGKFTYSDQVRQVKFDGTAVTNIYAAPNPTKGQFYVRGVAPSSTVRVLDMNGRVLQVYNGVSQSTVLDITNQPAGVYFVQVLKDSRLLQSLKLLKE
jgi:hypothetical protein